MALYFLARDWSPYANRIEQGSLTGRAIARQVIVASFNNSGTAAFFALGHKLLRCGWI
jgi:hypothetical protein